MQRRPLYIFLDLNQWIYLSRAYHGRAEHKPHSAIASMLLQKVEKDEVRVPLGLVHFLEHLQNENAERRKRLAEVFEIYSKGWCFASWSDICNFELQQEILNVFGQRKPTRPEVFGRGFMFTTSAGGRKILAQDQSKISLAFFALASAQPGALFNLLTTTTDENRKQQKTRTSTLSSENAESSDELRMRRRQCSREEYRLAQFATCTVEHQQLLNEQLAVIGRSFQDFLQLGKDGMCRFWSSIPSINVDCELTAYRDRQWSRKVQSNDVRDLAQLAIAVPYCDAIVVENFWKRAITETALESNYATSVFCDLDDLGSYLTCQQEPKW